MKFIFINPNSSYYKHAVALRISSFFMEMDNAYTLINDHVEATSFHIVCVNENDKVVGTGRLTLENNCGIISQMAIDTKNQKTGIGKSILEMLITKCVALNITEIKLSARKTAIEFYKKFEFNSFGELYASKKTGVIHQQMIKSLVS